MQTLPGNVQWEGRRHALGAIVNLLRLDLVMTDKGAWDSGNLPNRLVDSHKITPWQVLDLRNVNGCLVLLEMGTSAWSCLPDDLPGLLSSAS